MKSGQIPQTQVLPFITAGKAVFTIKNKATENRFTYRVIAPPDKNKESGTLLWVSVLTGPDNHTSYTYIGLIRKRGNNWLFEYSQKSKINHEATSVQVFEIIFNNIWSIGRTHKDLEFWHEGKCCRCGRRLNVPESIAAGMGHICSSIKLRNNR
jgi:hypothetical protein